MTTTIANPLEIAEEYIAALKRKDLHGIAKLIHCDIELTSPVTKVSGSENFLATVERLLPLVTDIRLRATFANERQAMLVYDFVFHPPVGIARAANLMTFQEHQIRSVELFLDPRPFENLADRESATHGATQF
jgi:hypothetical protein